MYSRTPWGGFGASHLAGFLDRTNKTCGEMYRGRFPYSEGIFEDANKFISLAYYSGECEDAFDALRAYVKYEFSCEDDALYEAVKRTETGLAKKRSRPREHIKTDIKNPSDVQFVYETLTHYNETLPKNVTSSRNFRLYYLRAVIDYELVRNDGYAIRSERCQNALQELCKIYYTTENTNEWVKPPLGI